MPADYPSTGLATSEVATYRRAQFRVQMDAGAVQEIALHLQHGGNIEPLVVFEDAAGARVLADGHHRLEGALAAKQPQVSVQIRRGTWAEALEFGWEANRANNRVRVTTSDKQRMIDLELEARPEWSDSRIAQRLGVDHKTVGKRRGAILGNSQDAVREVTRGGVTYTQDTANIGKRPAATPAPVATSSKPAFVPQDDTERRALAAFEALPDEDESDILDEDVPPDAPSEPSPLVLSSVQRAQLDRAPASLDALGTDAAVSKIIALLRDAEDALRVRLEACAPAHRAAVLARVEDATVRHIVAVGNLLLPPSGEGAQRARAAFGVIQGGKK